MFWLLYIYVLMEINSQWLPSFTTFDSLIFIMFAFKYLVTLALVARLVASVPIPDLSDEADLVVRGPGGKPSISDMANAVKIARRVKSQVFPPADKAVFWSGSDKNEKGKDVSVSPAAQKFAKEQGKQTINMALKEQGIKIPPRRANTESDRIWDFASKTWATRAKGQTDAVLGSKVNPDSVWKRVEEPALKKNDKVTTVTEHNLKAGTSKVTKPEPKKK